MKNYYSEYNFLTYEATIWCNAIFHSCASHLPLKLSHAFAVPLMSACTTSGVMWPSTGLSFIKRLSNSLSLIA